jgi:hypothetical protein
MPRKPKKVVEQVASYQQTFSSEPGKKVLLDLMDVHHMSRPTFVGGGSDLTSYREGERSVVLRILSILGTTPEKLDSLLKQKENVYGE